VEIVFTLKEIDKVAKQIVEKAGHPRCIAFFAPMGAGKTTLIKAICDNLDVTDNVSSPTYSIINEYETAEGEKVVHMDWYRLKDENDAMNAGVVDYMQQGIYSLVEWPERAPLILPMGYLKITIEIIDEQKRKCILN
jgi:tRNA threonylcarbamoyladenosine biosynthesis protein TsaE